MRRCVVLLSGADAPFGIEEGDVVICADSGYSSIRKAGLFPQYLVGDMDSIGESDLEEAFSNGVAVRRYPEDKDRSDGEIALDLAVSLGPDLIVLIGGKGGRADHLLSSFLLLLRVPDPIDAELRMGPSTAVLMKGPGSRDFVADRPVVSLVPLGTDCKVTATGLRWPLHGDLLEAGSTKGIHNEPVDRTFRIELEKGHLLVVSSEGDQNGVPGS